MNVNSHKMQMEVFTKLRAKGTSLATRRPLFKGACAHALLRARMRTASRMEDRRLYLVRLTFLDSFLHLKWSQGARAD